MSDVAGEAALYLDRLARIREQSTAVAAAASRSVESACKVAVWRIAQQIDLAGTLDGEDAVKGANSRAMGLYVIAELCRDLASHMEAEAIAISSALDEQ